MGGGLEHGRTTEGVEGEHLGSGGGGGADGGGDGVGDVVELEVEEDRAATGAEFADEGVAFGEVELEADLVPAAEAVETVDEVESGGSLGVVEGDDETGVHIYKEGTGSGAGVKGREPPRSSGSRKTKDIEHPKGRIVPRSGANRGVSAGRELGVRQGQLGDFRAGGQELNLNGSQSTVAEAERLRSSQGKVDYPVAGDRAAIVDADDDRPMVAQIGDADQRAKRESALSTGHGELVVRLAAGSGASLKELAVPGGHAELVPVVVVRFCLSVKVVGRRSGLRAGKAHNEGECHAGDGDGSSGSRPVTGSSNRVHNPPVKIVEIVMG
jgi:hypothetical protein